MRNTKLKVKNSLEVQRNDCNKNYQGQSQEDLETRHGERLVHVW